MDIHHINFDGESFDNHSYSFDCLSAAQILSFTLYFTLKIHLFFNFKVRNLIMLYN
jgi:hypothetical protein